MADTYTLNYNFTKPEPGIPGWDGKLNSDMDTIDAEIKNREDETAALSTSKATKVAAATTNNLAALDATGDLVDSGKSLDMVTAGQFYAHEASPPDMTVVIDMGGVVSNGALVSQAQQNTTIIENPIVDPYIVRIVTDETTGAYSIVYGNEDPANPVAPAIPVGKLPCTRFQVDIAANTAAITNAMMTDERTIIRDHGSAVQGYEKGNSEYIEATSGVHATVFDATAINNNAVWETVGPTTGTATNTWAALDNVPSNAKWIEVKIKNYFEWGNPAVYGNQSLFARKYGESASNEISWQKDIDSSSPGTAGGGGISTAKIPISRGDINGRYFELSRYLNGNSPILIIELVGFGV